VADGETLRVRGAGDEDPTGGPAGDLLVLISTRGHPAFRRQGLDIFSEVKLPAHRLGGGGPVRVPTIHGARRIDIPPGTAPGVMFRLRGCGVRRNSDGNPEAGDHFVRLGEIKAEDYERPVPTGAKSRAAAIR
jgi:DnaJ-class molecular chaperone